MMTEAEKRLRKNYIEKYDKGENISLYTNSIQCTKDIKEILNMLEEVRNRCNYLLNNNEVEINGSKYFKHSCDDIITKYVLEGLGE